MTEFHGDLRVESEVAAAPGTVSDTCFPLSTAGDMHKSISIHSDDLQFLNPLQWYVQEHATQLAPVGEVPCPESC